MTEPTFPRPGRRDPAKEDRLQILQMLESGAITADEAGTLLDALDRADRADHLHSPSLSTNDPPNPAGLARNVRIRVSDSASGRATFNLAVPLGLVDAGLTLARRFAPERLLNADTLRESITSGFRGSLLDVDDDGERVEIIVE